jgi:hypothetical protein
MQLKKKKNIQKRRTKIDQETRKALMNVSLEMTEASVAKTEVN